MGGRETGGATFGAVGAVGAVGAAGASAATGAAPPIPSALFAAANARAMNPLASSPPTAFSATTALATTAAPAMVGAAFDTAATGAAAAGAAAVGAGVGTWAEIGSGSAQRLNAFPGRLGCGVTAGGVHPSSVHTEVAQLGSSTPRHAGSKCGAVHSAHASLAGRGADFTGAGVQSASVHTEKALLHGVISGAFQPASVHTVNARAERTGGPSGGGAVPPGRVQSVCAWLRSSAPRPRGSKPGNVQTAKP